MAKTTKKKPAMKVAKKPAAKPAKKHPAVPVPAGLPVKARKPPKAVRKAESRHLTPLAVPLDGDATVLDRLWQTVENRRLAGDTAGSHSARGFRASAYLHRQPEATQQLGAWLRDGRARGRRRWSPCTRGDPA